MPAGRPTDYNQEIADKICEAISDGMSLREICKADDMPCKATVFRWLGLHKEFSDQYARAREEQAEALADDIVAIADNAGNPLLIDDVPLLKDGEPVMYADASAVAHARLKVDARKWVASKLKPKKYGDKLDVDAKHSGTIVFHLTEADADL
jgi:hypothetical protein